MSTLYAPAAAAVISDAADIRGHLETIWSYDTAVDGTPTMAAISAGQCVPSALLVNDILGGTIHRVVVAGESHYYNCVDIDGNNIDIDVTRDQFPVWVTSGPPETRTREQLLANSDVNDRYLRLAANYCLSGGPFAERIPLPEI